MKLKTADFPIESAVHFYEKSADDHPTNTLPKKYVFRVLFRTRNSFQLKYRVVIHNNLDSFHSHPKCAVCLMQK